MNVIYFNSRSFTSIQQDTTNTGIVCMSPNFQWDATICLLLFQNSYPTDRWNHLINGRSLLLQTYHFWLPLLDHLGKLWWCCWYRHYTWKMDLPLTFLWFLSISCEPSGYSFGRRLSYCQHLCDYYMANLQDLTWLTNCVCCIQVLFYWCWHRALLLRYYLSRFQGL